MLLLLTGSADGTSDLLVSRLDKRVFRFNYDLFDQYELELKPGHWRITNPVGHTISSETVKSAFWWKTFNYYIQDHESFIAEEVKYIFREIYHDCRLKGLTKGVPHDYHNHMGKINILAKASKYFEVPETLATFKLAGVDRIESAAVVAKSFASGLTTTNKALFTTEVDVKTLHPGYPWFLQEKIESDADVTVFICGDKYFGFQRSRAELKGLDWRAEQTFTSSDQWDPYELSALEIDRLSRLRDDLGVKWGRADFMRRNGQLVFLEYNANGQWVFLDYEQKYGLLDQVVHYLTAQ